MTCPMKVLEHVAQSQAYTVCMGVMTVYSIFAIDFEKSLFTVQVTTAFGIAHVLAISLFSFEIWLRVVTDNLQEYTWSFYFWIDVISTVSMVLEIIWIQNILTANSSLPIVLTFAKVIKATRLTKIGARVAKQIALCLQKNQNSVIPDQFSDMPNHSILSDARIQNLNHKDENLILGQFMSSQQKQQSLAKDESLSQQDRTKNGVESKLGKTEPKNQSDGQEEELPKYASKPPIHLTSRISNASLIMPTALESAKENEAQNSMLKWPRNRSRSVLRTRKISRITPESLYESTDMVERWERAIILPKLQRLNVDPEKLKQIQQKWRNIEEQQQQQNKQVFEVNKDNFKLGIALKMKIQKNIIVLIMSLIMVLPLISTSTWFDNDPLVKNTLDPYFEHIANYSQQSGLDQLLIIEFIQVATQLTSPLVYLHYQGNDSCCSFPDNFTYLAGPIQMSDLYVSQQISVNGPGYSMVFSGRPLSQWLSQLNLGRSVFVMLLLIFSTIIFMSSIEQYVLQPLEQMCMSINKISINPFQALACENQKNSSLSNSEDLETKILERAIIKMTGLLATGAGEFGAELIATKTEENPARKKYGIFMYVSLNHQQMFSNKLKDKMLPCLNRLALLIHEICVRHGGTPVQNDENGFLVYWKIDDKESLQVNAKVSRSSIKESNASIYLQKILQFVLNAVLEINIYSKTDENLDFLVQDPEEPEKTVFSTGLHLGMAIEGSIGSRLKLEAKCLGKDVFQTKKLARLAQTYGVGTLLSEEFCTLLGDSSQNHIRKVDFISSQTEWHFVYCFDISLSQISKRLKVLAILIFDKEESYQKRERLLARIKNDPVNVTCKRSKIHIEAQKPFTEQFYGTWNEAIEKYLAGDWDEAVEIFENIHEFLQPAVDGPAKVILAKMTQHNHEVPSNWPQFGQTDS